MNSLYTIKAMLWIATCIKNPEGREGHIHRILIIKSEKLEATKEKVDIFVYMKMKVLSVVKCTMSRVAMAGL
jgi:hypothetical protein